MKNRENKDVEEKGNREGFPGRKFQGRRLIVTGDKEGL